MGVELGAGLASRRERSARELDLAPRLEGDARTVLLERDHPAALFDALPADAGCTPEQRTDSVGPVVRHAVPGIGVDADLLVLRSTAQASRGVSAASK